MGEPVTKDRLSLEDLEATTSLRSGRKHILSILVENKAGVLTRVAGLFARRGFNIDTLTVGPTEDEQFSRITLTFDGAMHPVDQVTKQLHKLINVLKIRDHHSSIRDGSVASSARYSLTSFFRTLRASPTIGMCAGTFFEISAGSTSM